MGVYDRQVAQAKRVIRKKGQLVTWIKHNTVVNTEQPWKSTLPTDKDGKPIEPTKYSVYIVFTTAGSDLKALVHLMTGSSVPIGAPNGLMAQVPFEPEIDDEVDRDGEKLVIKDFNIVSPNGEVILYKLEFA